MAESDNGQKVYIATKADIARLEEQLKGLDRALDIRLIGIERLQEERKSALAMAITKAETAQAAVNASQNEFRGALKDQAALLATKDEVSRVLERVITLEKGGAQGAGRHSGFEAFKVNLFAILALLISLLTLLWRFKT